MPPLRRSQTQVPTYGKTYMTRSKTNFPNSSSRQETTTVKKRQHPGKNDKPVSDNESSSSVEKVQPKLPERRFIGRKKRRTNIEDNKENVIPPLQIRKSTRLIMRESLAMADSIDKPPTKRPKSREVAVRSPLDSPVTGNSSTFVKGTRRRRGEFTNPDESSNSQSKSNSTTSSTSYDSSSESYVPPNRTRFISSAPFKGSSGSNVKEEADSMEPSVSSTRSTSDIDYDQDSKPFFGRNESIKMDQDKHSQNSSTSYPSLPTLTTSDIAKLDEAEQEVKSSRLDEIDNQSDSSLSSIGDEDDHISTRTEFRDFSQGWGEEEITKTYDPNEQSTEIPPFQDCDEYDERNLAGTPDTYVPVIEGLEDITSLTLDEIGCNVDLRQYATEAEVEKEDNREDVENSEKEAGTIEYIKEDDQNVSVDRDKRNEREDEMGLELIERPFQEGIDDKSELGSYDLTENMEIEVITEPEKSSKETGIIPPQTVPKSPINKLIDQPHLFDPRTPKTRISVNNLIDASEPDNSIQDQNEKTPSVDDLLALTGDIPSLTITSPRGITFPLPVEHQPEVSQEPASATVQPSPEVWNRKITNSLSPSIETDDSHDKNTSTLNLLATLASEQPHIQDIDKSQQSAQWWSDRMKIHNLDPKIKKHSILSFVAENIDDLPKFGFDKDGQARNSLPSILTKKAMSKDNVEEESTSPNHRIKSQNSVRFSNHPQIAAVPQQPCRPIVYFPVSEVRDEPKSKIKIVSFPKSVKKNKF